MKKRIYLFLVLFLAITTLSGCFHEHDFKEEKVLATCTEPGYTKLVCECGEEKDYKVLEPTGHECNNPTCGSCNVCDKCGQSYGDPIQHDWMEATCTDPKTCRICKATEGEALGHVIEENDDYFALHECSRCNQKVHRESENTFKEKFHHDMTAEKWDNLKNKIKEANNLLDELDDFDELAHQYNSESVLVQVDADFTELVDAIDEMLEDAGFAYQTNMVMFYYNNDSTSKKDYNDVIDLYTSAASDRNALFPKAYDKSLRRYFYKEFYDEGWDDQKVAKWLEPFGVYTDQEYKGLIAESDKLQSDAEAAGQNNEKLYDILIKTINVNTKIAKKNGYDYYPDYAYKEEKERAYTPADSLLFSQYALEYLVPAKVALNNYRTEVAIALGDNTGGVVSTFFNNVTKKSFFGNNGTYDIMVQYFKEMNTTESLRTFDMYQYANDLFREGNYYLGKQSGAFTYYIEKLDQPMMYFQEAGTAYNNLFTFAHEFGHYSFDLYNKGNFGDLDLKETHSQGNEVTLLTYLDKYLDLTYGTNAKLPYLKLRLQNILCTNLIDFIDTILMCAMINEFETEIYKSTFSPSKSTFTALGEKLAEKWGFDKAYAFFDVYIACTSPCYYISYAMSAIPCLELCALGQVNGFETQKEAYLKLFYYTDAYDGVDTDALEFEEWTFAEVLDYAGLNTPFEETLYSNFLDFAEGLHVGD